MLPTSSSALSSYTSSISISNGVLPHGAAASSGGWEQPESVAGAVLGSAGGARYGDKGDSHGALPPSAAAQPLQPAEASALGALLQSPEAGSNVLLGKWATGEVPLLVPLVGGAATNM